MRIFAIANMGVPFLAEWERWYFAPQSEVKDLHPGGDRVGTLCGILDEALFSAIPLLKCCRVEAGAGCLTTIADETALFELRGSTTYSGPPKSP